MSQNAQRDYKRLTRAEKDRYESAREALLADPTLANPWVAEALWTGFPSPPDIRIIAYGDIVMSYQVRSDPANYGLIHIFTIQVRHEMANGS